MKIAPLMAAYDEHPSIEPLLVHTGQHYDANLSDVFFDELGMRWPDISLEVGSGSHARQTGEMMPMLEELFDERFGVQDEDPFITIAAGIFSSNPTKDAEIRVAGTLYTVRRPPKAMNDGRELRIWLGDA